MKCFVIMPFGNNNSDSIYLNWIKTAVEEIEHVEFKINCHRADKSLRPGEIITHVIENLVESELVIADLTGKNANVFYELGVRHTLSTNTILIAQDINDIPFDLRGHRIITYKFEPDSMLKLKKDIQESILSILNSQDSIDNPVRKYIYDKEVKKFFEGNSLPGYNLVETLVNELSSLKKSFSDQFSQVTRVIESLTIDKISLNNTVHENTSTLELEFYQGVWFNKASNSYLYCKIHNGQLLIPYCYGGNSDLTACYYDLKKSGKYLIGRFKWFATEISGFMFMETIEKNQLEGGWWTSKEFSISQQINNWELPIKMETMHRMVWERLENIPVNNYPVWVKKYFLEQ